MKVVVCETCDARNVVGGDCILCGKPLGSIPLAFVSAFATAALFALSWASFAWLTGLIALWMSLLFGVAVSGAVVQVSFGRGWAYQAIASSATIIGIIGAETLLILLLHDRLDILVEFDTLNIAAVNLAARVALHDPAALAFGVLGLMGGFWVWKQPSPEEDA